MSSPWLKTAKRIIGRRLRSGSLTTEDAMKLCEAALSSIRRQVPPPTASTARRIDHASLQELGRFVGECYRAGDLAPEDALDLFDALLPRATPGSVYALNQLLTVVARAPASSSVDDGPSLAISLYKRMVGAGANKVTPDQHTYGVIIGCYCKIGRLDLGFATFGRILKTGWRLNDTTLTHLLGALCAVGRTSDAMDIVLQRMPELGCTPNVHSFSTLLKGLCDKNKSQEALELLHMMAKDDSGVCTPDVVSYSIVIRGLFKQGQVDEGYSLFHEMLDHGIPPDVVTWNSIIDGLCKAQAMDKAEATLKQMINEGIPPNIYVFTTLINGFSKCGRWEKSEKLYHEMLDSGIRPNVVTYNAMMNNLCKEGRVMEAQNLFDLMTCSGVNPDIISYMIMIRGHISLGQMGSAIKLFDAMVAIGLEPNAATYNTLLDAVLSTGLKSDVVTYKTLITDYCKDGRAEDAATLFREMLNKRVKADCTMSNMIKDDDED